MSRATHRAGRQPPTVIALDFEGTLISNAVSLFPRPDLYVFLEYCREVANRVVVYTAVSEPAFRKAAAILCEETEAPPWFRDVEHVLAGAAARNWPESPRLDRRTSC